MITKLCAEIHQLFLAGEKERERELISKAYDLPSFYHTNRPTPQLIEPIMDLERKLLAARGANKQRVEECIFEALKVVAFNCARSISSPERLPLTPDLLKKTTQQQEKQCHLMALKLVDFAGEMFRVKIARDSFNTKRKRLALDIIECLNKVVAKTKDRTVAVTALNVQVEAGIIDEFEALAELDDWKERNYGADAFLAI